MCDIIFFSFGWVLQQSFRLRLTSVAQGVFAVKPCILYILAEADNTRVNRERIWYCNDPGNTREKGT